MQLALMPDQHVLDRESTYLERLADALIESGLEVTRVEPGVPERRMADLAVPVLRYAPRVMPWMRKQRARDIAQRLAKRSPEVIYTLGDDAWGPARELAAHLDVPLIVGVWSRGEIDTLVRSSLNHVAVGVVTATSGLASAYRGITERDNCVHIAPHIIPEEQLAPPRQADQAQSIAIVGGSENPGWARACLAGFADCGAALSDAEVILELHGSRGHTVWREADRLDLLPRVSAVEQAENHRSLLVCCDLLIWIDPRGTFRPLIWEAASARVSLMTPADIHVPLLDHERALIAEDPGDQECWRALLSQWLESAGTAEIARRTEAASRWVSERYRLDDEIELLSNVFHITVRGDSLAFAPSATSS